MFELKPCPAAGDYDMADRIILSAAKGIENGNTGGDEQCMSIWDIMPEHLYVSMGTNGVRMFIANPEREHSSPVTVYVQESALNEALDQMQRLLGVVKAAQSIMAEWLTPKSETTNSDALHALLSILDNRDGFIADAAARTIFTKHGRSTF